MTTKPSLREAIQQILDDYTALNEGEFKGNTTRWWSFAVEPATDQILVTVIKELEGRIGKKKLPAYRQGRNLPPEISGSETTDYARIQALKSHNQGYNEAIDKCKSILKEMGS